jgi:S-adenosyl-L-methionine hydrolase (adenosine-forming)
MLITLTTDFGTADHFVGAMKGVILGIAPRVRIVDITHEIAPFEVGEAAFTIAEAWRWFPKGTIHVVVVDPGVGTARRPILVEVGGHRFIGPDNGVFSMVLDEQARVPRPEGAASSTSPGGQVGDLPHKVRAIENPKLMLKAVSQTFHGRDVFAPAAAHLARGVTPGRFGRLIPDLLRSPAAKPVKTAENRWTGRVLKVDHFGNLITNFHSRELGEVGTRTFEMLAGSGIVRRLVRSYAESGVGEVVVIVGSSGYLEIAVNQGSAAARLGCGAGAAVELGIS